MSDSQSQAQHSTKEPKLWPVITFWTVHDVNRYICDVGYQKYSKCFTENAINGRDLSKINAFDLQRIGVTNMEDAIRLSSYIKNTATTLMVNWANYDDPPNISYNPGFAAKIMETEGAFKPAVGKYHNLRLPYRDQGDHYNRYAIPTQSYNDYCMIIQKHDA